MTTTEAAIGPLPESYHRAQLRRAAIASTVGTTIEWYDFLLYGQVASIVFAKLFFPKSAPLVGTLEAFGIYFVGFVARPIGAAIFGHYGDRIGRKAAHRHLAIDRPFDIRGGSGSNLRPDRHLGCRYSCRAAPYSRHRGRRRMGWLRAARDGVGAD